MQPFLGLVIHSVPVGTLQALVLSR